MNKDREDLLGIVIAVLLDKLDAKEVSITQEDIDKIHNKHGEMFGLNVAKSKTDQKITVKVQSAFDAFIEQLLK